MREIIRKDNIFLRPWANWNSYNCQKSLKTLSSRVRETDTNIRDLKYGVYRRYVLPLITGHLSKMSDWRPDIFRLFYYCCFTNLCFSGCVRSLVPTTSN